MTAIAATRDTTEARGRVTFWRKGGGLIAWSPLPGLPLALGVAITALSLIVVGPLAVLVVKAASVGPDGFVAVLSSPRIMAALKLSFGGAALAVAFVWLFVLNLLGARLRRRLGDV